ncbi:DUF483 domain-containing protein [Candidatus Woesearchaeota archaeon]|nr:DUF483 domain-containing protein [Candidatus Woesearchaeota archaeon]
MIKKLSLIFGSKTKAQEILFLQDGAKKVVRQGFYDHELPQVESYCKKHHLYLVKSRFKVILADDSSYSNKGIRIPETDKRPGMFFVYISKDEEKSWLAAYHEMMNNSGELGKVLGYPKCCVEYFTKHFSDIYTDLQKQPTNPWTNLSKRDKDSVLISHFPCDTDCHESMKIARMNLDIITAHDPKRAKEMMKELWSKKSGNL